MKRKPKPKPPPDWAYFQQLLDVASRIDPGIKSPEELEPVSWGDRKFAASVLMIAHHEFQQRANRRRGVKRDTKKEHEAFFAALEVCWQIHDKGTQHEEAIKQAVAAELNLPTAFINRAVTNHRKQCEEWIHRNATLAGSVVAMRRRNRTN